MGKKRIILWIALLPVTVAATWYFFPKINWNPARHPGEKIDSLNGIYVYYNGGTAHVEGRNLAPDGYNLGLKFQCVEFVKRYYYERFNHRMPDAYGHAKDFFDPALADGAVNEKRNLRQYRNGGGTKPAPDDLVIFSPTVWNRYGHVAIVSRVTDSETEIIQQNPGPFAASREAFPLCRKDGVWYIENRKLLGWLRKK